MAHQTHNIHWDALTSCLQIYSPEKPTIEQPINLYLRFEDDQDKKISHFVASFVNSIQEHTACERKKYPETFDIPEEDDLILGVDITHKITPLVHKWRESYNWALASKRYHKKPQPPPRKLCTHDKEGFECGCVIPLQERKASAFLRRHYSNDCHEFYETNTGAFYNIEVVKTLILYEEMEPVLRIGAHPEVDYESWQTQRQCYCMESDAGWDTVYEAAFNAYFSLNILYSFPELWAHGSSSISRPTDYRSTKLYQTMLRSCTFSDCTSEVPMYPHRAFFGIGDDQFRSWPRFDPVFDLKYGPRPDPKAFNREFPYGLAPIEEVLNAEEHDTGYLPDVTAVAFVRSMLYKNGLPVELIDDVLEEADYTVKRRLVYAHDPFHLANVGELQNYLKYCWRVMINCNMMADQLRVKIDWEGLIYRTLSSQLSSPGGRKLGWYTGR